jgi:ArsR family transcriptional regulator
MNGQPQILERMSALADDLRSRLLLVLERDELTVSEICEVLQLPQSTVSRHLKTLADGGWVASRRDTEVAASPAAARDRARLAAVLEARRSRSRAFFAASAESWDRMRDELFGSNLYLHAALGLLDPEWTVADLGCGTGRVTAALAPVVHKVIAIDASEPMLDAARSRLAGLDNVELRRAELEALPLADRSVDAALVVLVLHHLPQPQFVLDEVARVLRPGGRAIVVDMLPHDREAYRQEMGHVWLGFSEAQLGGFLRQAGLDKVRVRALPAEAAARGPLLCAAAASRPRGREA